jgi:hypothetical protein
MELPMTSPSVDRRFGLNSSIAIKAPCRVASTSNLTLSGLQTVDGVSLASGDRVLVAGQTSGVNNGIYVVDTGSWQRATDFDDSRDVTKGTIGVILEGTYQNQFWTITTSGTIRPGTTSISFSIGIPPLPILSLSSGSSLIGFIQAGVGAIARWVQDKLRERITIDDYTSLQTALTAISGSEGTGYGANAIVLDLLGKEITFTGTIYWPINVILKNGTLTSTSGQIVLRNPYLANTGLRSYTEYWPYMKAGARNVKFNSQLVLNCYIGALFDNTDHTGANSRTVLVNSNGLWTEYNTFRRSTFASNATAGFGILLDGNLTGTSTYSTGAGAGTADGSFGYTKYIACKTDSTASAVGIKIDGGANLYNGKLEFDGYARGAGGAVLYVTNGSVNQCDIGFRVESFGAAANVISVDATGSFKFNSGYIKSASPQMTMAQAVGATITNNNIWTFGVVLQDSSGSTVAFGDTVQSALRNHLLKRLDYFSGSAYVIDTVTGATVTASTALESRVVNTGQITSRPNDSRSASSRNWAWRANNTAFGDYCLLESTSNTNDPATVRVQVQSGGSAYNTTGTWGTISDATTKKNIVDARNYLSDLRKLRVVKYSLLDEFNVEGDLLGLIAQEVEQVFPGLVSTAVNLETGKELKQVKTSVLTFMLLKSVQELAEQIEAKV